MEPNDQQGGNPFAGILAQLQQGQGQQQPQQMPQQAPQMPQPKIQGSSQQQTAEQMGPKQLMEGQEGTGSKFLMQALQGIQGYIQMSTNPQKIQMLRQLATVFTNLLANEQEEASQELEGMSEEGGEENPALEG